jgi:hypothetical protein
VRPVACDRARRLGVRPAGVLLTQRRVRVPWERLGRERLLRAWACVLRGHALPAEELRLVGVFGPAPLGAVEGVALDGDGERALIALRRTRIPGPAGDVVLARHVPSGRLVTVTIPEARSGLND